MSTLHLDDLVLLVAKCLSGFTHFVIRPGYAVAWYLAIVALSFLALLWLTDAFDNSIKLNSHKRIAAGLAAIPLACLFIASLLAVAGGVH